MDERLRARRRIPPPRAGATDQAQRFRYAQAINVMEKIVASLGLSKSQSVKIV
jgi:hypothetical protein